MTDEEIKHMVDRFLGWRLPKNFDPDGGISFKREYNSPVGPVPNEPTGTNLFSATQADAMVRYMVEEIAALGHSGASVDTVQSVCQEAPLLIHKLHKVGLHATGQRVHVALKQLGFEAARLMDKAHRSPGGKS